MSFNLDTILSDSYFTWQALGIWFLSVICVTSALSVALFLVKNVTQVKLKSSNVLPMIGLLSIFFFNFFFYIRPTLLLESFTALSIFYFTLAVTIFTDFYTYLISTLMTLYLLPVAFFYAYQGYLSITLTESIISSLALGLTLQALNLLYYKYRNRFAFGEGDRDLLMYIAAFIGVRHTCVAIFYASILGSVWGLTNLAFKKKADLEESILPFGTCLGLAVYFHFMYSFHGATYPLFNYLLP